MNLPVQITRGPTAERPRCPSCGRPMVYISKLHRFQCYLCLEDDRKKEREASEPISWLWWIFIILLSLFFCYLIVIEVMDPGSVHITNMTEPVDMIDNGSPPTGREGLVMGLVLFIIAVIACLVAYLMERGKPRCPGCGEVLRLVQEVDKYKCLHCGSWYDREDIDVEVVD